jgi:hypothetical protein
MHLHHQIDDNDQDHLIRLLNESKHLLENTERKLNDIMADVTALTTAVTDQTVVVNEAVAKLTSPTTPTQAEVDAVTNAVQSNTTALQNALPPAAPVA